MPSAARADAIIRTQAMLASTIAEFSVDEGKVVLDLEIGAADLEAFSNLVPDALYERLGNEPRPLAKRLVEFFGADLTVVAGESDPLPARILEMAPAERVRRDAITGEQLPQVQSCTPGTLFPLFHLLSST